MLKTSEVIPSQVVPTTLQYMLSQLRLSHQQTPAVLVAFEHAHTLTHRQVRQMEVEPERN